MEKYMKCLALLMSAALISSCTAETDISETNTGTSAVSETLPEETVNKGVLYTTTYPDGTIFTSSDGLEWYCDGGVSEKPLLFVLLAADNTYMLDSDIAVTVYNHGVPDGIGTSSCGGYLFYEWEEGWDYAPYRDNIGWTDDFSPLMSKSKKRFTAFSPDMFELPEEGRYRYEIIYNCSHSDKEYVCSAEFYMEEAE